MKIKRFISKDSRGAMACVRAELGPDAAILSNRTVNGQVELVAAVEFDEVALSAATLDLGEVDSPAPVSLPKDSATLDDLQRQLASLRSLLEGKLSQLAWRDMAGRPSTRAALNGRLLRLGLSRALSAVLLDKLPAKGDLELQWRKALDMLAQQVLVMPRDSLLNDGGIVALVGSTGVGKTTTIAKLAARFVLRHGSNQVGLITTDCYRIGGQEQLETFANYLGVPMVVATDAGQLKSALYKMSRRKLVLIDTAGMSQRDVRLVDQFSTLNSVGYDIDTYVVLSATAQQRAVQEVVQAFGKKALAGAMITKLDECAGLGGVLDVVVRNKLKLAYVSMGQKVPEDLTPARTDELMSKAMALMAADTADPNQRADRPQRASMAG